MSRIRTILTAKTAKTAKGKSTIPAGDLDGDGAADLFTVSSLHTVVGENTFSGTAPQIHVHYGVLAAPRQPPVR